MNRIALTTGLAVAMLTLAACNGTPGPAQSNVAQGSAQSFDAADANNDGVITKQEALATPGLDFARLDADKNNAVTRQEYDNAMARSRPGG